MDILHKYFDGLTEEQIRRFSSLHSLYEEWNAKINVISRKDLDNLYERHVLHSLSIACLVHFEAGSSVMDLGTGGGFPGIPLAIFFPDVHFTLVDSIGKKMNVVTQVANALGLTNVTILNARAETVKGPFDFVVSRAVAEVGKLYTWSHKSISKTSKHTLPNGIISLKGGDLKEELEGFKKHVRIFELSEFFEEEFFQTKKILYVKV